MRKVRFEIQIPENDDFMMKVNDIIHHTAGWVDEDGEIPGHNIKEDEYFAKIEYTADMTKTDIILSNAAYNMNDVFSKVSEMILDEIPKMADSENKSIITFEIIVPDNAGNDAVGFCEVVRETVHDHFNGAEDYVESNVIVWSNTGEDDEKDTIVESGVTICLDSCVSKETSFVLFMNSYFDVVGLPEYFGIVFGRINKYEEAILEKIDNVSDKISDYVFTMDDLTAIMIKVDQLQDTVDVRINPDTVVNWSSEPSTNDCSEKILEDLESLRNNMNDLYIDQQIDAKELINMLDDFITNYNN